MHHPFRTLLLASLVFLNVGLSRLGAQMPPSGTVTANGSAEIKGPPQALRLQLEVIAKGKTIQDALAKLKERREAVRAKVAELGAAKERVTFTPANISSEKTDRQLQMEQMLRSRMRSQGKKPPKAKEPPVVLSVVMKADFPLTATDPEELLVAVHTLQGKLKANLGNVKDAGKLSPEEEELVEELGGEDAMGETGEPKRGEPLFVFVRKISEEERTKALKQAYTRARHEAARLATSAGAELGGLHHLATFVNQAGEDDDNAGMMMRQQAYYAMQQARMMQHGKEENMDEAIGITPAKVALRVGVSAYFNLKGNEPASSTGK